jgi:tetratricopeptide (TPR) repeat protein
MVDWSFDLLRDGEKALFARLSVFAGGFDLAAAEAVCADAIVARADVLERLCALVAQSLVLFDADADRYGMLETIAAYARRRLEERGELAAIRARHRDAFAAIVAEAEPALPGGPLQAHWLSRLELEHDNLRAALGCSLEPPGGAEIALGLCGGLYLFWIHRGHQREGYGGCRAAIARAEGDGVGASMALTKALLGAGTLATYLGEQTAARQHLERALALARTLGERSLEARVLNNLASAAFDGSDFARAQRLFEDAVRVNRELGLRTHEIINLVNLGNAANSLGDFAAGAAPLERALALARADGLRLLESDALGHLAMQAQYRGDFDLAEARGEEALAIDRALGVRSHEAQKLLRLAEIAAARGDAAAARSLSSAAAWAWYQA